MTSPKLLWQRNTETTPAYVFSPASIMRKALSEIPHRERQLPFSSPSHTNNNSVVPRLSSSVATNSNRPPVSILLLIKAERQQPSFRKPASRCVYTTTCNDHDTVQHSPKQTARRWRWEQETRKGSESPITRRRTRWWREMGPLLPTATKATHLVSSPS